MKAGFLSSALISSKGMASPATHAQPPQDLLARRKLTTPASIAPLTVTMNNSDVPPRKMPEAQHKKPTASSVDIFRAHSKKLKKDNLGRVRMSIRMAPDAHLHLKLLAAHSRKSAQCILEEALQEYTERHGPDILPESCNCVQNRVMS